VATPAPSGAEGRSPRHASLANRKDLRNAVEAANAARSWGRTTGHARAQVLYFLAENLSARASEFARRIDGLTGGGGAQEVDHSIRTLFRWAAWADKVDGRAPGCRSAASPSPCASPWARSASSATTARRSWASSPRWPGHGDGNRTVLVASEPYPLAAN
jgi:aldehyde dehydrogenase (NAD+)